jgi:hypothetical protein
MQLIFIAYRVIINYCLVHTVLDIYKKETSEYRRRKINQKWLIFFSFLLSDVNSLPTNMVR